MQHITHGPQVRLLFATIVLTHATGLSECNHVHGVFGASATASLMPCAVHESGQLNALFDVEGADASGCVELVAGDREQGRSEGISQGICCVTPERIVSRGLGEEVEGWEDAI